MHLMQFNGRSSRVSKLVVWLVVATSMLVIAVTHAASMGIVDSGDRYALVKLSSDGRFVIFVDRTGEHPMLRRQRVGETKAQDVLV